MSTVTLDQMRSKLLSVDDVRQRLAVTEPLSQEHVTSDSNIRFTFPEGWNADLDEIGGTDRTAVLMRVNGVEKPMTKDAALIAASNVGLPGAYVKKTPGPLVEQHMNYWYGVGMGEKAYNVLTVGEDVAAFVKPTIVPFSNLALLDSTIEGIQRHYGADTEILADYKIRHNLGRTDVRLIVPEHQRTITGGGLNDVPSGEADLWSAGITLTNSLIGKSQTAVEGNLFRWWCTNGATTTNAEVGTWSRRSGGQGEDVYVWAAEAVDEVLGGMEHRFDEVQALTGLNVAGNTADVLRDIFTQYQVPVSQREAVTNALLESENLTMYAIMNAITQTANGSEISADRADRMMRIGGAVPTAAFDTLKARVWDEGHTAPVEVANPYVIAAA